MPTRYLKPGIRDSERIEAVNSPDAEILYYRLLVSVDDFGRTDARPLMVKSLCFPVRMRATADKCMQWLQELVDTGLLVIYQSDGKPYLQLTKWDNKPRADRSKYPAPPADADKCMQMLPVTVTDNREPETVNRPSAAIAAVAKPPASPCPHQEIIELYHRILPVGRQVSEWNGERAKHLKARWREKRGRQSLDWWERFFTHISKSKFLTGQVHSPNRDPFELSLAWIVKPDNFIEILDGKYNRDRAT